MAGVLIYGPDDGGEAPIDRASSTVTRLTTIRGRPVDIRDLASPTGGSRFGLLLHRPHQITSK